MLPQVIRVEGMRERGVFLFNVLGRSWFTTLLKVPRYAKGFWSQDRLKSLFKKLLRRV